MKIVVRQGGKIGQISASKGMAMLEVLIAMLIVGIGILPLVFLQVQADRGVIASYTKVEHNAAALSIMDLIASDANRKSWAMNTTSGHCITNTCEWREKMVDDILLDVLPNPGSGLVCITENTFSGIDKSTEISVELWWFSAGRGQVAEGDSKESAFTAADCTNTALANKWNIDTVQVTRIF